VDIISGWQKQILTRANISLTKLLGMIEHDTKVFNILPSVFLIDTGNFATTSFCDFRKAILR